MKTKIIISTLALAAAALVLSGCGKKGENAGGEEGKSGKTTSIQNIGSDTMVNLAQAWAEAYHAVDPSVSVEVSGGGSGVGVSALINGTCDIANSSRKLEKEEEEKATAKYGGKHPEEFLVGYDALAIYVHPSCPLNEISVEQLSELFKEGGKINKWSELGVTVPGGQDEIVRVSRQNNSGTYHYFREHVVGKKNDFKKGSRDMSGSKDVVELVANTPSALGYSGLGYKTDKVKIVNVSKKTGEKAVVPSIPTTLDGTYPIARPMFMYTPPGSSDQVKKYLHWVRTPPGQKIVVESGYVPLPEKDQLK
ncbi:MAG TPA: phosphate ABC transporter substrate-binding protein [Candidatus Limnocylindria bacterium]|nr:phosphate ABC transporter substrate-binding protein [Candidatus Limnocylindria bacterium]